MTNELKPCPFCGGEAKLFYSPLNSPTEFWVKCKECGAGGVKSVVHGQFNKQLSDSEIEYGKRVAIESWNLKDKLKNYKI